MGQDEEHLRLLSIFHYIVGGLAGLFALFPIFHLILGLVFILAPEAFASKDEEPPPAFLGWFFVVFAAAFILLGWIFAVFVIVTGRFLARHKHRLFCLVLAVPAPTIRRAGHKVVRHSQYVVFQMAKVAVLKALFRETLDRIRQLRFLTIPARAG
jgi:hypothetical protein